MKIVERKSGLEGFAKEVVIDGVNKVSVLLDGQEEKIVAESTFIRNYKKIKEETNEIAVDEEIIENIGGKEEMENLVVEEIVVNEVPVEETKIEEVKEEKVVEVVLTEAEQSTVFVISDQIASMVNACKEINKVIVEKNTKAIKVILNNTFIELNVTQELKLAEPIFNELKEKLEIEVEFDNKFKKSNPAAFKARGVKAINKETGEEHTFKTRNDAMIWITKEHEDGKIFIKPTYYKVKKALERNEEYVGYIWSEIVEEETIEQA